MKTTEEYETEIRKNNLQIKELLEKLNEVKEPEPTPEDQYDEMMATIIPLINPMTKGMVKGMIEAIHDVHLTEVPFNAKEKELFKTQQSMITKVIDNADKIIQSPKVKEHIFSFIAMMNL